MAASRSGNSGVLDQEWTVVAMKNLTSLLSFGCRVDYDMSQLSRRAVFGIENATAPFMDVALHWEKKRGHQGRCEAEALQHSTQRWPDCSPEASLRSRISS